MTREPILREASPEGYVFSVELHGFETRVVRVWEHQDGIRAIHLSPAIERFGDGFPVSTERTARRGGALEFRDRVSGHTERRTFLLCGDATSAPNVGTAILFVSSGQPLRPVQEDTGQ